jgi:NADH-quinone oxidoreductase subunit G
MTVFHPQIAQQTNATTLNISATANSMAGALTKFVPGKGGLDANAMLASDLKATILLDVYPQFDFHNAVQAHHINHINIGTRQ